MVESSCRTAAAGQAGLASLASLAGLADVAGHGTSGIGKGAFSDEGGLEISTRAGFREFIPGVPPRSGP
jgi:hypothetical protein